MKIDAGVRIPNLMDVAPVVQAAEELGFDGLWTSEIQHDPFLPLAIAAEHTRRVDIGTSIAVAFARSPTSLAHMAWDLAGASKGRFILGLGTQVKAHIERRFGMAWEPPVPKLREMILAMRAVWRGWQADGQVNFRGDYYQITLMTPFFNPGPIDFPDIPIYIAGVNEHLCRLAGELCQGFHVHPFHTTKYIREIILPNIERGAQRTNRARNDVQLSSPIFVATDEAERETVRAQIAVYASTPSYRPVLQVHGWEHIGEQLSALAGRGAWNDMPHFITDEILETIAIVGPLDQVPDLILRRYSGLIDRLTLYSPFTLEELPKWRGLVQTLKG